MQYHRLLLIRDWSLPWLITQAPSQTHSPRIGWARATRRQKWWLRMACFWPTWRLRDAPTGYGGSTTRCRGSAHPAESGCSQSDSPRHMHSHIQAANLIKGLDFKISSKSIYPKSYGSVQMHLYERVNLWFCKHLQSEDLLRVELLVSLTRCITTKFVRHWRLREKCRSCKWVLLCRNKQFLY